MFDDGAWLGWILIVGSALVAMILFGFILPLPRSKRREKQIGYRGNTIERGVRPTLPVTPEKQKGQGQPSETEARRVMQQRRRPRRVLLSRERTMHEEIMRRKGEDDA